MVVALGNDHAGFPMRAVVKEHIESLGHTTIDHGCHSTEPVDFPDIVALVCTSVRGGEAQRGVMVCGTGVGASIAANKTPQIRAALCHDIYSSHQCVEHDDVNILCLGAQIIGPDVATEIVSSFLSASFSTEPHFRRRVQKLYELEAQSAREILEGEASERALR